MILHNYYRRPRLFTYSYRTFSNLPTQEPIQKKTDFNKLMEDPLFKSDELIESIKLDDKERTNWRRIKNKKPVSDMKDDWYRYLKYWRTASN